MIETQVHGLSRRRSRKEADRLVEEFERSGQSRQAFCREHGLSLGTLDNYRRRRAAVNWAHSRRRFIDALKMQTKGHAADRGLERTVMLMDELFAIDREAREQTSRSMTAMRCGKNARPRCWRNSRRCSWR